MLVGDLSHLFSQHLQTLRHRYRLFAGISCPSGVVEDCNQWQYGIIGDPNTTASPKKYMFIHKVGPYQPVVNGVIASYNRFKWTYKRVTGVISPYL